MASLISKTIKKQFSFKKRKILNFEIKMSTLINKIHIVLSFFYLRLFHQKKNIIEKHNKVFNKINFENKKHDYKKNGYIFFENVINNEFHNVLFKNWPKRILFRPRYQIEKSYNTGFKFKRGWETTKNIGYYPYLEKIYKEIQSENFAKNLNVLNDNEYNLSCVSMTSSLANNRAVLFPHVDDISITNPNEIKTKSMLNCIFFIYANPNKTSSGGTGIYKDNEFKSPIFEPENLINSLLIYKTNQDFFHGFKEQPKNSYRYAITAQFNQQN
jgi:hypothetical protein